MTTRTAALPGQNPYQGPRPFESSDQDRFYGRDLEIRDLAALVTTNQVVLFYAQSGAGKTSLIQAGLVQRLSDKGFDVLYANWRDADRASMPSGNIYVSGLLTALLHTRSIPPEHPATFADFLKPADDADGAHRPFVLIIDQFEEVFTTYPDRWAEREPFFEQLGEAISQSEARWVRVVLTMREDYLAELDPYADLIPEQLATRFRLERLSAAQALEAINRPLEGSGVHYVDRADELLRDRLLELQTRTPADQTQPVLGPYVEPVHLQVVCQRLWDKVVGEDHRRDITPADLQVAAVRSGDNTDFVTQALQAFYEQVLAGVLAEFSAQGLREGQVRLWFERHLITQQGTRNRVYMGDRETAGLPNDVVLALANHYLIRGDPHAGLNWYELTHDRLVVPIQRANQLPHAHTLIEAERSREQVVRAAAEWQHQLEQRRSRAATAPLRDVFARNLGLRDSFLRGPALRRALEYEPLLRLDAAERGFLWRSKLYSRIGQIAWRTIVAVCILITLVVLGRAGYRLYLRWQATGDSVRFPAGTAVLGSDSSRREVRLPAFSIDRYEVSYRQYDLCVRAGRCSRPLDDYGFPGLDDAPRDWPVTRVTAYQAAQFCDWIGRRLPTSAEWERAARGTAGRPWPWDGEEFPTSDRVHLSEGGTAIEQPVAVDDPRYQLDRTPEGVWQMAGNVAEWTSTPVTDQCRDNPYTCGDTWDGQSVVKAVTLLTRGLSFYDTPAPNDDISNAFTGVPPNTALPQIGFRCADD
jgi:hypothetical protein